jgi:hypothetical protein
MGDRYDRDRAARLKRFGSAMPPEPILTWGIGDVAQNAARLGHNGGPPLDEEPGYLWRKYRWTKAYKEAWKTPSMAVLKFRVARAEAAGLSYHDYMLELLDTGRHLQKDDVDKRVRAAAKPTALGGPGSAVPTPAIPVPAPVTHGNAKSPSVLHQLRAPSGRAVPQPLGSQMQGLRPLGGPKRR